ncbi:Arm DNA-binding domain-containing protein [Yoonia sp. BS5-3]|uniref:Arm DNA-binding domain-containing protein n=1 Tax=Yoonia phaeophyticola TaxID=3137369 RepID=A0ABZ2V351_9RHOB
MPLSDIKVKNLKSGEKPYKVADFEGLFVLVKVSGAKSWRFKYRIDRKEKLLVIGDYPAVSLAKARQARDLAKMQLADGIDPNEAKQERRRLRLEAKGHTFEKVGTSFLAKQRKEGKSAATLSKTEYHLKLANSDFGRCLTSAPMGQFRPI